MALGAPFTEQTDKHGFLEVEGLRSGYKCESWTAGLAPEAVHDCIYLSFLPMTIPIVSFVKAKVMRVIGLRSC